MQHQRTRLAIVAGTTLTLVLAGAGVAGAQSPETALGGDGGPGVMRGFGRGFDRSEGRGFGGGIVDRIQGRIDNLVRQETVVLDDEGTPVTSRVEHGTVSAVTETSITIDLATGESVTVTTDADTDAYAWETGGRPSRDEVEVTTIAAGADVVIWSEGQADGSFLAERITILPVADADATEEVAPEASPEAVG